MNVTRIRQFADLASLTEDWHRLTGDDPFVSWDWMSAWWKHYGAGVEVYVLVVKDDQDNVIGIAPWIMDESATLGRRVRFLGAGRACSDYVRILAKRQHRERVVSAIVDWLYVANRDGDAATNWDYLSFDGVRSDDPGMQQLQTEFASQGYSVKDVPSNDSWRATLQCSWDDYVGRLPSKQRRRKLKDTCRKYIDAGRTEFEYATSKRQFNEFFDVFVQLHQDRRNSLGQDGCFADSRFGGFLRDTAERFFDKGELLLSRLMIDGQPAATSLGVLKNNIHFMYQTGMSSSLQNLNCGWVMNVHSLRYAIDNNIDAIDYLRGDEVYKAKLGCEPIPLTRFRIVANQPGAIARNRLLRLRRHSKSLILRVHNFLVN